MEGMVNIPAGSVDGLKEKCMIGFHGLTMVAELSVLLSSLCPPFLCVFSLCLCGFCF